LRWSACRQPICGSQQVSPRDPIGRAV
jgi:hypothetical protein